MATVNIEYDTVAKTCKMSMNGMNMDDMSDVSLSRDGKKWRMSARKMKKDEENDIAHYEDMYCSQKEQITLEEQISKFIESRRK